ncbi:MAG: hypothetical protein AAFP97_07565 [Pseudomonadota bacterium]
MADVGFLDLLDDGVGFGAKTAKTIKVTIFNPRRYFLAAQTPDWSGFSPSIRVYVVLLAASSYLRYLYLGDGQLMTELYVDQFKQVIEQLSEREPRWLQVGPRDLANATLTHLFFLTPFIGFTLYTLFGMVWMAYAEKLSLVVRIRYIYALLIPATVFMLIATIAMVTLPRSMAGAVSILSLAGSSVAVAITAYFGAYPEEESKGGRIMRAITLGIALIAVMMLSTTIGLMWSTFMAMDAALSATVPVEDLPAALEVPTGS